MKYFETSFVDYINKVEKNNLHSELENFNESLPKDVKNLPHLILYGPSGVGKYTQALNIIKKYSKSNLKYERKINIFYKKEYTFKISDIHFEIDMSLLGCNAKLLWNEIFYNIIDIVSTKPSLTGIILCKNFHNIHSELLDIFYSYMQTILHKNIKLVYIFLTENISFISDSILTCSEIVPIARPKKMTYKKCTGLTIGKNIKLKDITNIKNLYSKIYILQKPYENISKRILYFIINYKKINFLELRDSLYDIFICHLNLTDCIWYILNYLIHENFIKSENINDIMVKLTDFFILYNNNYRPIYHLEQFLLYLCKKIHGF